MAQIFPDIKTIGKLTPSPTEGELTCLNFLKNTLSDDFEIYFQPHINGDNPDIVLMKKDSGILIFEVKDWNLNHYEIDKDNNWKLKQNNVLIKSPIDQVKQYKKNLYSLHIPTLLEKKIVNNKLFSLVHTVVYFHNETEKSIFDFVGEQDKYIDLLGRDSLTEEKINNILTKRYLNQKSYFFTEDLYNEFKRFLQPSFHTLEQGIKLQYSDKQRELSQSNENKQQKIKGVAGSGKTLVLATRAVNAYKRTGKRVLILTYNIALRNYIHDQISKVKENFEWSYFYIDNYHNFINSQANNLNVKIKNLSEYENSELFENEKTNISKYDSIFIDEIQDYKTGWINIVKKYFLSENGEFVVFGDEKQNIYGRKLDVEKNPNTTIPGRWAELNEFWRLSDKIVHLVTKFQKEFFDKKYLLDDIHLLAQGTLISDENIEHYVLNKTTKIPELVDKIFQLIREKNIHPNDICILSSETALLRNIDYEIRTAKKEKTKTTFETQEIFEKLKQENNPVILERKLGEIRKNKKFNFWMNPGISKLSTIHSFKGWEIPTLFLIVNSKDTNDELLYTAITRCRYNLFIINIENPKYTEFFSKNISPVELISAQEILSVSNKENAKTIEDIEIEDLSLTFPVLLNRLKGKDKNFKIALLGEITGDKNDFKAKIGSFFYKYNIKANDWDIEFINNQKLKNSDILKSLKKGQSSFSLIITGQIYQHSSRNNQEANLLEELNKEKYIEHIVGCSPKDKLSSNILLGKLDEYLHKEINSRYQ